MNNQTIKKKVNRTLILNTSFPKEAINQLVLKKFENVCEVTKIEELSEGISLKASIVQSQEK